MSKVICDSRHGCKEEHLCGGAKPHDKCDGCGHCPFTPNAKCIEVAPTRPEEKDGTERSLREV